MATSTRMVRPGSAVTRGVGRSVLMTLPMVVWSLLMFFHPGSATDRQSLIAAGTMVAVGTQIVVRAGQ